MGGAAIVLETRTLVRTSMRANWPLFLPAPVAAKGGASITIYGFEKQNSVAKYFSIQLEMYGCDFPEPRRKRKAVPDNDRLSKCSLFSDFCPEGWNVTSNGECLKLVKADSGITLDQASEICANQNASGILYQPISQEANANLVELANMMELPQGEQAWIGIKFENNDLYGGDTWQFIGGLFINDKHFTNWADT